MSDHHQSELLRLRAGYDGCGCADCQEFYKMLDLKEYGERVITADGLVVIVAGRKGADLWKQYHQGGDSAAPDIKEVLENNGKLEKLVAADPPNKVKALLNGQEVVAKIPTGELLPVNNVPGFMQHAKKRPRGRPRKEGEVHRVTEWRRRQKEPQGVLM